MICKKYPQMMLLIQRRRMARRQLIKSETSMVLARSGVRWTSDYGRHEHHS